MDRSIIAEHLVRAERHIVEGARQIEQQRTLVGSLQQASEDCKAAKKTLKSFEDLQEKQIARRDWLQMELRAYTFSR